MPTNSTPSLPTSPSPPRKTFSSQHNVWNKLLSRAERRAPQMESHLFLPHDPGDDHLRASFEDYLINHQLQIDAVFRIPVQEPARPKRKAMKRCRPRQSTSQAQQFRAPSIARVDADDDEFDVVFVEKVRASALPSINEGDDYIIKRKATIEPSESGSDIPLSQRLRNDRALYSEASAKPSLLILPQQHAPERSRRRVSKSTPLSTLHNPLSSLEPSEDSPTLYSCDSRAVVSRIESTPDVVVEDSSLEVVPVVPNPDMKAKPKGAKHDSRKSDGRGRLKRTKHDSDRDLSFQILSLSTSSGDDEMPMPKATGRRSRRSKRTLNICASSEDDLAGPKGAKTRSNQAKGDSKILKDCQALKRAKIGSSTDVALSEMYLIPCSEEDVAGSEGGSKSRQANHNSKKSKSYDSVERTRAGSKADKSLRELDLFSYSEDDVNGSKGRSKSRRMKHNSEKLKNHKNLQQTIPGSKPDGTLRELDLFSCSDNSAAGFEGRSKSRRVKHNSKKPKNHGSLGRTRVGSKADESLRELDLFSYSKDTVATSEGRSKPRRGKRISENPNPTNPENLERTKIDSKRDEPIREMDLFSYSEDNVAVSEGRPKPRQMKLDSKNFEHRGNLRSTIGSKADGPLRQVDLCPPCESDLVGLEAVGTKTRRAERDSNNRKSNGTVNEIEHGSKRDMTLGVISLSSSCEGDLSQSQSVACHRPRFAFRKSAGTIMPRHAHGEDDHNSSESGIIPLPPDDEEICGSANESPTFNRCQASDGKGNRGAALKLRNEVGILRPPKFRRIGTMMENDRVESKNSQSPDRTEGSRASRASRPGRKRRRPGNHSKRSKNKSGKFEMDFQPKATPSDEKHNIYSQVSKVSQVRSNAHVGIGALSSEVEIDGSGRGGSFGNLNDLTVLIPNDCNEDGSLKDGCRPRNGDLLEDKLLQRPNPIPTPPHVEKRRRLTIPLTLRIKQPRDVDMHPNLEKRLKTCEVRGKEKSKIQVKLALGKQTPKGQNSRRRSRFDRIRIPFGKTICQSSPSQVHVPMRNQGDITLSSEFSASIPQQRYILRSCKQGSGPILDSPPTRSAANHRVRKPQKLCNLEWSSLKTAAATNTTGSCDPSLDAEFDAVPSSELLHTNSDELPEVEKSHSSADVEAKPKRLCSGKTSPSKGPHIKAKADISPKQSSSKKWKRDTMTSRSKRRVKGESSAKRSNFSGSNIGFPLSRPLRKSGRGKG